MRKNGWRVINNLISWLSELAKDYLIGWVTNYHNYLHSKTRFDKTLDLVLGQVYSDTPSGSLI